MNDFVYKSSPHEIERSVLQKAVRRGDTIVVEKVVKYLVSVGDSAWLRKRLYVIAYEECWPLASGMNPDHLLAEYLKITTAVKNKNAYGLGHLARSYNDGNFKLDNSLTNDQKTEIQDICHAIKTPSKFWELVEKDPRYQANKFRIQEIIKALPKATIEDDKDMIYAAAYFTLDGNVPVVKTIGPATTQFPYWIGIDRHTEVGKKILAKAAEAAGVAYYNGLRLSFYLEGAVCNQISDSPYWNILSKWQIERMGMTEEQALEYWEKMKPIILGETKNEVDKLLVRINNIPQTNEDQLSLF